jgi:tetratricopeptide (TPR) repeat protein
MAHYFLRNFREAAAGFERALNLAKSSDSIIDCSNWLYVSLQRAGEPQRAAKVLSKIGPDIKNTEPHMLFYLRLLHFYQGKLSEQNVLPPAPKSPSDVEGELSFNTINYGVGNWHLYHGDRAKADEFFRRAVAGYAWNSWGFIGSELELSGKSH